MQAKTIGRTGTRFFAHDRATDACWLNGETALHRRLKTVIAEIVRRYGCLAEVEAIPVDGDQERWRADVLATAPGGRRLAFEVQLAAMTLTEGRERQDRYQADGIETVWLTTKQPLWLWNLASVQLEATADVDDGFVVIAGLAKLINHRWEAPDQPVPLDKVIGGLLAGRIERYSVGWLPQMKHDEGHALVPSIHARDYEAQQRAKEEAAARRGAREEAEAARRRREEEQHRRNIERMYARQQHLLPIAVAAAARIALKTNESVRLGVPATLHRHDVGPAINFVSAIGNERTAYGAAVWLGVHRDHLRLFAVLAPAANQIEPDLAASWKRRGIRVYVADDREAARLLQALGNWPPTRLHLHRSDGPLNSVDPALRHLIADKHSRITTRRMLSQWRL